MATVEPTSSRSTVSQTMATPLAVLPEMSGPPAERSFREIPLPIGCKHCKTPQQVIGVQQESPLAWSCDGRTLAYVSANFQVYLLGQSEPTQPFKVIGVVAGPQGTVHDLRFHPTNPNLLACAAIDGLYVWDTSTSTVVACRDETQPKDKRHDGEVLCLCWNTDGSTLLSGGRDANVLVWDALSDFKWMEAIVGHKAPVLAVVFDPHTKRIATAGRDSTIKVWDGSSLEAGAWRSKRQEDSRITCSLLSNLDGHRGDVACLEWGLDGTTLFSGARDNTMKVWDMTAYSELREIRDLKLALKSRHGGDVRRIKAVPSPTDPSQQVLLSCSMDGTMRIWHLAARDGPEDVDLISGLPDDVTSDASRDAWEAQSRALLDQILASEAAVGSEIGRAEDVDSCVHIAPLFEEEGAVDMRINPTRPIVAITSSESSLLLLIMSLEGPAPLSLVQRFDGHTDEVLCAQLVHEDSTLLTASADYHVSRYNTATIAREMSFSFGASAHCLALGRPDAAGNQFVFVGGAEYVIKAFAVDLAAYQEMRQQAAATKVVLTPDSFVCARYEGHAGRVDAITINATGTLMASGGRDFSMYLWSLTAPAPSVPTAPRRLDAVPTVEPLMRMDAHAGQLTAMAFSSCDAGNLLASSGADHVVKVWDVKGRRSLKSTWQADNDKEGAHKGVVTAVAWGKNASAGTLFSAGWDKTVKVWDGRAKGSPRPLKTLLGHTARINDLDTSDDGTFVVSVSGDFTARLWNAYGDFDCVAVYYVAATDGSLMATSLGTNTFVTAAEKGCIHIWPVYRAERDGEDPRFSSDAPEVVGSVLENVAKPREELALSAAPRATLDASGVGGMGAPVGFGAVASAAVAPTAGAGAVAGFA